MIEQTRIAKAACDAGLDLSPVLEGEWTIFGSAEFPVRVGVAVMQAGAYRLGLSDARVGSRIGEEFELSACQGEGGWGACFDVDGYVRLHRILARVVSISRALHQDGMQEFQARTGAMPDATEVMREVRQRVGQDVFRKTLIGYWGGRCAVTGLDLVDVLRASHIKPWADCATDAERLDVFNGLLLAPHLDALFDKGLITFSDDGRMVHSTLLDEARMRCLGIAELAIHRVPFIDKHLPYLAWHRAKVFKE